MTIKLQLRALERRLTPEQRTLAEDLEALHPFIDGVLHNVRRLYFALSPGDLDDLGLTGAVRQMLDEFAKYHQKIRWQIKLDTGLLWQRDLSTTEKVCWYEGAEYCCDLTLGGRKGWRLPTIQELSSLIDPTHSNPALPSAHPFTNIQPNQYGVWPAYWSATSFWAATGYGGIEDTDFARTVFMGEGIVAWEWKRNCYYGAWCVRSGQGVDLQ